MGSSFTGSSHYLRQILELAVERSPMGIVVMNFSGRIVYVNSKIERAFGYTRSELLERSIELLVPSYFRSWRRVLEGRETPKPEGRANRLTYGLRKNGIQVPIELEITPFDTPEGFYSLNSIAEPGTLTESDAPSSWPRAQTQLVCGLSRTCEDLSCNDSCGERRSQSKLTTPRRALVVDDDPQLANILGRTLERLGIESRVYTSSLEALQAFCVTPGEFDVVVTDDAMAPFPGTELSERIRDVRPDIPVLLVTGLPGPSIANNRAISACLPKPFTVAELARALDELVGLDLAPTPE